MTSSSLLRAGTHAVARELAEEVLRRSGKLGSAGERQEHGARHLAR